MIVRRWSIYFRHWTTDESILVATGYYESPGVNPETFEPVVYRDTPMEWFRTRRIEPTDRYRVVVTIEEATAAIIEQKQIPMEQWDDV